MRAGSGRPRPLKQIPDPATVASNDPPDASAAISTTAREK
jgi:hypothetical protein